MTHIDEHTLELYVLGAEEIAPRRREVEAHLLQCHGCKQLVERMTAFYAEAEKEFQLRPHDGDQPEKALVRSRTQVKPLYEDDSLAIPLRPVTRLQRFQYFVRRHPVMTGSGTFAVLMGLALLANMTMKPLIKDANPSYTRYNTAEDLIEVHNSEGELLWNLHSGSKLRDVQDDEDTRRTKQTLVANLDGDSKNEVITTLDLQGEAFSQRNVMRAFDSEKTLLFETPFDKPIHYLERDYPEKWDTHSLLVEDFTRSGKKDIIVSWNCNRSPTVITRVDTKGTILGEYWHFGAILGIYAMDLNGDGRKELVLSGMNDTEDTTSGEFACIAVLDPTKIIGASKSVCSKGFHLPESDAEKFYIPLPRSSLSSVSHKSEFVRHLQQELPDAVTFAIVNGKTTENERAEFEYIFSRDMRIKQVKSSDVSVRLYERLVDEGKLTRKLDETYLNNLKNGVRYWDGKEWVKEAIRIQHSSLLAIQR